MRFSDRLELRHLRALVALADDLHFGRAADRLGLAQSTLSRTIADLESIVETTLVERSQRTVGLTPAGRVMLGAAEGALEHAENGLRDARAASNATAIGLMSAHGHRWLPQLRRALPAHPLTVREVGWHEGYRPIGRDVDVGIFPLPLATPLDLRWESLGMSDVWAALPASHPLVAAEAVPFGEIATDPLIVTPLHPLWRHDIEILFQASALRPWLGPQPATMGEALELVAQGEGWMFSSSRGDFHPWEGVALRPMSGVGQAHFIVVWNAERASPATLEVVEALIAISQTPSTTATRVPR